MKKLIIAIVVAIIVIVLVGAGLVSAGGVVPYEIVYSVLPEGQRGPSEIFTIPQYNLICVYKGISLDCTCPCTNCGITSVPNKIDLSKTDPPKATNTAIPGNPTITPTATSIPPTTHPKPEGIWIIHYNANGVEEWNKCMPASAWNGHQYHAGHIIQDGNLGPCYLKEEE